MAAATRAGPVEDLRERPVAVALGVAGLGLVTIGGPLGVVVAAAMLAGWRLASVPVAVVLGQFGLVLVLAGGPTTTPFAQAGVLAPLVVDAATGRDRRGGGRAVAVAAGVTGLGLVGLATIAPGPLWGGVVVLAGTGTAAYLVHRHERVVLGLAGEAP